MISRKGDEKLTPQQLEKRAAQRRDAAKLLPPGRVRDIVLEEALRDAAMAELKRRAQDDEIDKG